MAPRLGHSFGIEPQFWINLQAQFEMATVEKETGEVILKLPAKASLPVLAKLLSLISGAAASVLSGDRPLAKTRFLSASCEDFIPT